jgi:hypothetical protein
MRWIRGSMFALALLVGVLAGTANAALNAYLRVGTAQIFSPRELKPDEIVLYLKIEQLPGVPSGHHDGVLSSNRDALAKDTQGTFKASTIMVIAVSHAELAKAGLTAEALARPRKITIDVGGPVPNRSNFVNANIASI